ncbi:MAG: hypothetical protein HMLKMBBP_02258 [Planctomycetes bacterium]|nr:hypothetical protein [Planctomycetota bacterium]
MTLDTASRVAVGAAVLAMIAVRAPHGQRSRAVAVAKSFRGRAEAALLTVAWISFVVPLVWICGGMPDATARAHSWTLLVSGAVLTAASLVLFHRSHADLAANWSITLEIREGHSLVTSGVYRRIRHPMYAALLLFGAGVALMLPDVAAGPSYLAAMVLLTALRLGPEERMMAATFGDAWTRYAAATKRLVPFLW